MALVAIAGRTARSVHTAAHVIHERGPRVDELGTKFVGKPLSVAGTEPQHQLGAASASTAADLASPAGGRAA
jgi:hypothetical protein